MRRLSEKQIRICETARVKRCRCRCRGMLHGIRREGFVQMPMFHIPPELAHTAPAPPNDAPASRVA